MDLQGRVALVPGASGGIGASIARALGAVGVHVAVGYHDRHDAATETCAMLKDLGRRAEAVQLDQTDPTSIEGAVDAVAARFGRLDVLVNNAGWNTGIPFPDLDALTVEIWDRILATNARGPFLLARAAARHMLGHGGGSIV